MMLFSKKNNTGQASLEYLLVFTMAFVIMLPMLYLFYDYSTKSSELITSADLAIIGNDIINAAESVYYMGRGSRLVLDTTFPDGLLNITILSDWDAGVNELIFNLTNGKIMAYFSNVNINGSFGETDITPGLKHITVEATNNSKYDYVLIDIN